MEPETGIKQDFASHCIWRASDTTSLKKRKKLFDTDHLRAWTLGLKSLLTPFCRSKFMSQHRNEACKGWNAEKLRGDVLNIFERVHNNFTKCTLRQQGRLFSGLVLIGLVGVSALLGCQLSQLLPGRGWTCGQV